MTCSMNLLNSPGIFTKILYHTEGEVYDTSLSKGILYGAMNLIKSDHVQADLNNGILPNVACMTHSACYDTESCYCQILWGILFTKFLFRKVLNIVKSFIGNLSPHISDTKEKKMFHIEFVGTLQLFEVRWICWTTLTSILPKWYFQPTVSELLYKCAEKNFSVALTE